MESNLIFNLPPILGLLPLIIYIVLSFREDSNPVLNVAICVIIGAILNKQNVFGLGSVIADAMGSFMALIGFIIMLGSGLGAVINKVGVAENVVHMMMDKFKVNNERKAILVTMATSIILVTLLGTMAGANAIIAPIVIPLIATIGITPSTLSLIFQGAGQTGLFLGPFTPPMVTLMEITGLSYGKVLLYAGLPVSILMWIVTYFMATRNQKLTKGTSQFILENLEKKDYVATKEAKRATNVFFLIFIIVIIYGIINKGGAAYAVFIMITVGMITGVAGGLKLPETIDTFISGMTRLMWLFVMFVLFEPFLNYVEQSGAFEALFGILEPLLTTASQTVFSLIVALIGIFGINGAAVAQSLLMNELFGQMATQIGTSMGLWALVLLVGSQITSFAYPGGDMLGAMGLAQSKEVKPMLKQGYTIIICLLLLLVVASLLY